MNYSIKQNFLILCLTLLISFPGNAQKNKTKPATLKLNNFNDTVSYIFGSDIGRDFINNAIEINNDIFLQGLKDAYSNVDTIFTKDEIDQIMKKFQSIQQVKIDAKKLEESAIYKAEAKAFLENNLKQPGVKQTTSGLQYKVLKEGSGDHPKSTNKVTVHYEGRFINGKVFDSSYQRNEPATFPLNGVIKGWTEGLQLMTPGSFYEFYIPSDLAYGDYGTRVIPGGALLIFKVELISFE
jgi:FKBP-type peptidyl-prolyl cis-trans isomerase